MPGYLIQIKDYTIYKKKKKETPIGGIEPPAAVWETAMLATTPYRMVEITSANYVISPSAGLFSLAL